eukprot:XP_014067680.1 PREDICTED: uncharacterized protein LOC106611709 [Salmo salar]
MQYRQTEYVETPACGFWISRHSWVLYMTIFAYRMSPEKTATPLCKLITEYFSLETRPRSEAKETDTSHTVRPAKAQLQTPGQQPPNSYNPRTAKRSAVKPSSSFLKILRGIDDLEQPSLEGASAEQNACSQSPSHYCRPDRPQKRIPAALCTLNDDIDAILPFCRTGFTLTPPGTTTRTQRTTCAQVHCAESPQPEKCYWSGNLLLQETALHGQDSNETCPAESGRPGEKSLEPTVSAIRQNSPRQKSRDSSPAYNGTEDHTHREHVEDFGTPDIPNKTTKPDDFTVLNDIPEVDDLLLCELANLLDSSNSYVETPKPEIEPARFIIAFSRALKSRNVFLHRRMGALLERQYSQDLSFWRRTMPRV